MKAFPKATSLAEEPRWTLLMKSWGVQVWNSEWWKAFVGTSGALLVVRNSNRFRESLPIYLKLLSYLTPSGIIEYFMGRGVFCELNFATCLRQLRDVVA